MLPAPVQVTVKVLNPAPLRIRRSGSDYPYGLQQFKNLQAIIPGEAGRIKEKGLTPRK